MHETKIELSLILSIVLGVAALWIGLTVIAMRKKRKANDESALLARMARRARTRTQTNISPAQSGYRVMADYGSSGIWKIQSSGMFRHLMVDHALLKLPPELSGRFTQWIEMYEERTPTHEIENLERFNAVGIELARALKIFLGKDAYVEYQGEQGSDDLLDAVPIDVDSPPKQ